MYKTFFYLMQCVIYVWILPAGCIAGMSRRYVKSYEKSLRKPFAACSHASER